MQARCAASARSPPLPAVYHSDRLFSTARVERQIRKLMPNIANVLKDEIARIARKELRAETDGLKKAVAQQRKDIAALKRQVTALEKATRSSTRSATKGSTVAAAADADGSSLAHRFSATRLAAQRKKLGLSAAEFGKLIGASGQSVYKWESGNVRPRAGQLEAIAKVRTLGKREVGEILSA